MSIVYPHVSVSALSLGYFHSVGSSSKPSQFLFTLYTVSRHIQDSYQMELALFSYIHSLLISNGLLIYQVNIFLQVQNNQFSCMES